jgi:hypothetical protein
MLRTDEPHALAQACGHLAAGYASGQMGKLRAKPSLMKYLHVVTRI